MEYKLFGNSKAICRGCINILHISPRVHINGVVSTTMPRSGFEPMITVFELSNTTRTLYHCLSGSGYTFTLLL
jgi:hypothetical protein